MKNCVIVKGQSTRLTHTSHRPQPRPVRKLDPPRPLPLEVVVELEVVAEVAHQLSVNAEQEERKSIIIVFGKSNNYRDV